ncbi:hypothetical protein BaRGS_00014017 [Batillaria attramentaria]|uniref:Secreted protein n=1 Tax=Batillaria attramentaria TaxID=370345 RepID=A0ABD0L6F0_9CAEN
MSILYLVCLHETLQVVFYESCTWRLVVFWWSGASIKDKLFKCRPILDKILLYPVHTQTRQRSVVFVKLLLVPKDPLTGRCVRRTGPGGGAGRADLSAASSAPR